MSEDLEELFGDAGGAPRPRSGLVWALLVSGLVLTVIGLLVSSVPGALLVLGAWMAVEKETDRVESGYLPADVRPAVRRQRQVVFAGLVVAVVLMMAQLVLLGMGVYDSLWGAALRGLGLLAGVPN